MLYRRNSTYLVDRLTNMNDRVQIMKTIKQNDVVDPFNKLIGLDDAVREYAAFYGIDITRKEGYNTVIKTIGNGLTEDTYVREQLAERFATHLRHGDPTFMQKWDTTAAFAELQNVALTMIANEQSWS